jgi:hypothetical protein
MSFKSGADYFIGNKIVIPAHEAAEAVATSKRFVAHFAALVTIPDPST